MNLLSENILNSNIKGSIMWLINDKCNYNCSYCLTQARFSGSKEAVNNYKLFLKNFKKKIPRGWNFYIGGGGEPTIHPDFFKIVEGLAENGYNISLITNLSMSFKNIDRFFSKAKGRCLFFSASLHLEEVDFDEFYSKVIYIRDNCFYKKLCVTSVAIPSRLNLLKEYSKLFSKNNIVLRLHPYRSRSGKVFNYSDSQLRLLRRISQNENFQNPKRDKFCVCGCKYGVMNPHGEFFRCTSAMRHKDSMGNVLEDDFCFFETAKECPYNGCFCRDDLAAFFFFNLNN